MNDVAITESKTFEVGNGAKITGTLSLAEATSNNNYFKAAARQSSTQNSIDIVYEQSLNDAIADSSAGEHVITLVGNTTPTANLGELAGTQLTIKGEGHSISGTYHDNGTEKHYEGITVVSEQKLIINNVGSVDETTGNILNSWKEFKSRSGGAIYNDTGTVEISNSSFSNNSAAAASAYASVHGGAIYNDTGTVEISNSSFSNNSAAATATTYAYARGGAIYNDTGTVEISNSSFSNNSAAAASAYASVDGGAISNLGGTVEISNSSFSNNSAAATATTYAYAYAFGGVIYNGSGGTVEITDSSFSNNYATATATAKAYGGAIFNSGTVEITDSSFSNNYATADGANATANGGAIYNNNLGKVDIIASTKNSVFSGNYTIVNETRTKNDIYNSSGTINLYAASEKTISFDGGIVSQGDYHSVNINVKGTTTYDVAGTVLFKTGSVNSKNNFTLGAGTLKLESGVSQNWTNNSLTQTGGTLNLANGVIEETAFTTLNSTGGKVILDIDFTAGTADKITAGTLTNAIEISGFNILNGATTGTTKTFNVGNGAKITGERSLAGSNGNNYFRTTARQSSQANSIEVTYGQQSLNDAILDSSVGNRKIELVGNTTATANLGDLAGTQLTIDGGTNKYGISGSYGADNHYEGITVGSGQKLIINNVGSVDDNGNIIKSWNGFAHIVTDANAYGGAIYNNGTLTITGSSFSNNYVTATAASAYAYAYANASARGGAISNVGTATITGSSFSNNYVTATAASAYATATASARGGAISNVGTATITDSSFSKNYATATADAEAYGGAIYNGSIVNIIASTKDSIFSGNYTEVNGRKTNNDIYNSGTTNLYAASGKTISFDGGIVSAGTSVNINVKGTTTYDVAGTVLFKTGSVNSKNNFTLGAGTLKLESGVTWTNNTLTMNDGTLDIGSSDTGNIGTLEYNGGSLTLNAGANINIDISETEHDQIVFSNNAQFILNGGKITVDLTDNAAVGEVFEIMTNVVLTGTLDPNCVEVLSAPEGWDTNRYFIASMGVTDSTNSLLLTVVPEPSLFGLFAGLAALALAGTRRRRK